MTAGGVAGDAVVVELNEEAIEELEEKEFVRIPRRDGAPVLLRLREFDEHDPEPCEPRRGVN